MSDQSVAIAVAWIDAANRQDFGALVALSQPNIEIVGPRGSFTGVAILRDWLARAGLTIANKQAFAKDAIVVMAQHGIWHSNGGQSEADFVSRFVIVDNRVQQYERSDNLEAMLQLVGLSRLDEVIL